MEQLRSVRPTRPSTCLFGVELRLGRMIWLEAYKDRGGPAQLGDAELPQWAGLKVDIAIGAVPAGACQSPRGSMALVAPAEPWELRGFNSGLICLKLMMQFNAHSHLTLRWYVWQ